MLQAFGDSTLPISALYHTLGRKVRLFNNRKNTFSAEVTYRMVRNPDKQSNQKLYFEGKFDALPDDKFVPVPVKKGSMILINGVVSVLKIRERVLSPSIVRTGQAFTYHA